METDSTYGQVISLLNRKVLRGQDADKKSVAPSLTDMLCTKPADPSATAFLIASLMDTSGPILWVQDHSSRRENGHLYTPSIIAYGINRPVLRINVSHPRDVLWAMEEGAACTGLSAVVGEIHGTPAVLDFTATKRLVMRGEASGVPIYLIRSGDPGVLSAARERWRVTSLPSLPLPQDNRAPGLPRWDVDLFRARGREPGRWVAKYDPNATRTTDRLNLVSRADAGKMDTGNQSISDRTGG